jgi:hypothetical protein
MTIVQSFPNIVVLVDDRALLFKVALIPSQRFARRTRVTISLGIPDEVSHPKLLRCSFILLPDQHVGFDLLCLDAPVVHGCHAIGRIPNQTLWFDPKAILDPVDHGLD